MNAESQSFPTNLGGNLKPHRRGSERERLPGASFCNIGGKGRP